MRAYVTRWSSFASWCDAVGHNPLSVVPDTVVCYLEAHADSGSGFSFATLRHTASVITKVHELEGHPSPCKDRSVKEALQRLRFQLAQLRAKVGALTPDNCDWIRSYANDPRDRGRGQETEARAARRGRVDVALVYVLSESGLSAARGVGADLGRRPMLGRRQRSHHRARLSYRHLDPGGHRGRHRHNHGISGRHPLSRCG